MRSFIMSSLALILAMQLVSCRTGGGTRTRSQVQAVESPGNTPGAADSSTDPTNQVDPNSTPEVKVAEGENQGSNPILIPEEKLEEGAKPTESGLRTDTKYKSYEDFRNDVMGFLTARDGFSMEKEANDTLTLHSEILGFKNEKGQNDSENLFIRLTRIHHFFTIDKDGPAMSLEDSREMSLVFAFSGTLSQVNSFVSAYKLAFQDRKVVQDSLEEAKRAVKYDEIAKLHAAKKAKAIEELKKDPFADLPAKSPSPEKVSPEKPSSEKPSSEAPAASTPAAPAAPAAGTDAAPVQPTPETPAEEGAEPAAPATDSPSADAPKVEKTEESSQ